MPLRRPSTPEIILQALVAFAMIGLGMGFVYALAGDQCPTNAGPGRECWMWGAEGPFADFWSLRSKANTLVSIAAQIALLLSSSVLSMVARKSATGTAILIGLPAFGFLGLFWLDRMLVR